jgi:hypothetical protein
MSLCSQFGGQLEITMLTMLRIRKLIGKNLEVSSLGDTLAPLFSDDTN